MSWEIARQPLVAPDRKGDVQVSPFLGARDQIAVGDAAAATFRSDLAHPECWEFDVKCVSSSCCRASCHHTTSHHGTAIATKTGNTDSIVSFLLCSPRSDSDMCCGGALTSPGFAEAMGSVAFVLYSPSSQGRSPLKNCSVIRPPLGVTNFNGVATANVTLTTLLGSHFESET